ncbi:hypothetical protein [Corynebacterium sp.]|uniref:hypothetical protein n=1 Tax=Corynebacterium TaxID=1716 RepID=UPI0025875ACC|nr:hypothetical protein [Corynebacterium sp.]
MSTPQPRWEQVGSIGLTSHAANEGAHLPGALTVHCFRTPTSTPQDAPYVVELENTETGESTSVAVDRHALLSMALCLMDSGLRAHPTGVSPADYFQSRGGEA